MAKARRGRPKLAQARRRQTSRAGRAAPKDFGTDEIRRLKALLNPGKPGLPVAPLEALFCRDFIDERSYRAGICFASLSHIARDGLRLGASVQHLWQAIVAGEMIEPRSPAPTDGNGYDTSVTAADRARERLATMRAELQRPGEDRSVLSMVTRVAVDQEWTGWLKRLLARGTGYGNGPILGDYRALGDLREGLGRLAQLDGARWREVAAARELAAE